MRIDSLNRRDLFGGALLSGSALALRGYATAERKTTPHPPVPVPDTLSGLYVPRLQLWGFDYRDPILAIGPFSCSFQIFTLGPDENSYGLSKHAVTIEQQGSTWLVKASAFATAGQQEHHPGSFEARIVADGDRFTFSVSASSPDRVRAAKIRFHELPPGAVAQTGWDAIPNYVPLPAGINFNYPEYTGGMPVWFLQNNGARGISFASHDLEPRPKRFAAYPQHGASVVELIFEEDARRFSEQLTVPEWEVTRNTTLETAMQCRMRLLESQGGLKRWESRTDVPDWAREIRLVLTLHGMHWSGYIFNDYRRMLDIVQWVTDRIDGKHVLAFLAAWEGRYYRKYGDSKPDARMGGEAGFRNLIDGIHARGAHAMAMYSGNYPQPGTPGYETYAPTSGMQGTTGFRWSPMRGYVVDWGLLRGNGMEEARPMNPGAPAWREFLTRQVSQLTSAYNLDGAYFDTQPNSENDRRYNAVEGLQQICADLRAEHPALLLSTESWFDLSLAFVPTCETPGGPGNWTSRYHRRYAHLAMGEPSCGSTGVHELGYLPYDRQEVLSMYDWPTVAFVEDTITNAPEAVKAVIAAAKTIKS